MQGLIEFAKTLGGPRIAAMAAVTVALIGFFAFVIMRVTTPQMTPLFTDLSLEDSAAIAKELDREGVAYQLRNDGNIIMVPADRVARVRMTLAGSGLPKGGGIGYEIFDKSDALGTTSFVQNINSLRALEGELGRTIQSIDRVEAARVHLVMPERPLFSRDKVEPSASIVLKVRGTLEQSQVRAIRHLVATAVNGLNPQRISIVDEQGQLLADGATDPNSGGDVSADERQASLEKRLRQQVEAIVSSVVGPGHSRIQVNAEFDFNRITQTSDKYDPDGRVLRSSQTREESTGSTDANQQVTVGNELPGANQRQPAAACARCRRPRPEPEVRGNRQLRDFQDQQGRSNRRRPHQPALGRGPGRRHLRQGRQGRHHLSAAQQRGPRSDRDPGALRDRFQSEARRSGRGRQSALCRHAGATDPRTDRLAVDAAFHQGRHHARHRNGRDGHARPRRPACSWSGRSFAASSRRRAREMPPPGTELIPGTIGALAASGDVDPSKAGEPSFAAKMIDIAQIQGEVHAQSVQEGRRACRQEPGRNRRHHPPLAA